MSKYQQYKPMYKQRRIDQKKHIREFLRIYKDTPCTDCGIKYPYYVMDLDHREPEHKVITPSHMKNHGWSDTRILTELQKCDVVCSNCHRERTHGTRPS